MTIYNKIHDLLHKYDFSTREKINFYGMITNIGTMTTNSINKRKTNLNL